jgi:hypothetical protein
MRSVVIILFLALTGWVQAGNLPEKPNAPASILSLAPIEWALAQIESGHLRYPDRARGAAGEVSRFQIMPAVWKDYSKSKNYSNPAVAWSVARRILKDRHDLFVQASGRPPTAFDLYVMWNKPGLYQRVAFNRNRLPKSLRDTASRFENLVHSEDPVRLSLQKALQGELQVARAD